MFGFQKLMICVVALACLVAPAMGSPVGGDKYDIHTVQAYSTDVFNVKFYGNEAGAVVISGDGDTDLDLFVYDENGNLVGSDTDGSDDCVVRLNPRWTGTFRLKFAIWAVSIIATKLPASDPSGGTKQGRRSKDRSPLFSFWGVSFWRNSEDRSK